ncbi:hypothetical protein [Micromonospora sp. CPCC 206061]|uniref:hypothetical protein n=1 Tax=Micromonospora sp. CPCC 206061 TaxID=3122410 RepID=UPI002FEFBA8F
MEHELSLLGVTAQQLHTSGLRVVTTIDAGVQRELVAQSRAAVSAADRATSTPGAAAVAVQPSTGAVRGYYAGERGYVPAGGPPWPDRRRQRRGTRTGAARAGRAVTGHHHSGHGPADAAGAHRAAPRANHLAVTGPEPVDDPDRQPAGWWRRGSAERDRVAVGGEVQTRGRRCLRAAGPDLSMRGLSE